jgi:cell division protein FtsB
LSRTRSYKRGYTNYNYSSSAYAYEQALSPAERALEEERKEQLRRERVLLEGEKRKAFSHKLKLTAAIAVVFGGCFIMMNSYASVTEQRIANNKLKDELAALKSENSALQADITDSVDLEYIREEAINRLGMTEPQAYQIVYIDVPKQSYNMQYSTDESSEEEFSLKSVLEKIKNLLKGND